MIRPTTLFLLAALTWVLPAVAVDAPTPTPAPATIPTVTPVDVSRNIEVIELHPDGTYDRAFLPLRGVLR